MSDSHQGRHPARRSLFAATLTAGSLWLAVPSASAAPAKVTICHATSSVDNPYNEITVNANAINGHSNHAGPIFPETDANGNWGDIIPVFTYSDGTVFPGLNWDSEGMAVLDAGCQVDLTPIEPPESTTTTLPATTTTLPPATTTTTTVAPTTTTTSPSGPTSTVAPTSLPSTTTTSTIPVAPTAPITPTPTTTVPGAPTTSIVAPTVAPPSEVPPPVVDPPNGAEIVPPTEAKVIDPGGQVVDLGPLTPTERVTLEAELDALAATGTNSVLSVGAGIVVIGTGGLLLYLSRRRRP
jgi:LPXTG-motif cell wall-anchored protein